MSTATTSQRIGKIARDWIPSLLLLSLLLIARSTLADHYHVPSGSMKNALLPGDHVLVNKSAYGLRIPFTKHVFALRKDPQRGEVVILDSPENDVRLIKRVVAVGGDRVSLLNGRLTINGRPLASPYDPFTEQFGDRKIALNLDAGGGPDIEHMIIPAGHVLLLGDHRGASNDGRYFGTVPAGELYGRASGVFWRESEGPTWLEL
jgi:signal peptidase I